MKVLVTLSKIFLEFFISINLKRKIRFAAFIFILLPIQAFLEVYSIALLASVFTQRSLEFSLIPNLFDEPIYNSVLTLLVISIVLYLLRIKNLFMVHTISSELTFYWQKFILDNMSKYGREESFLDIMNSKNNYLSINKDLNNVLQNEILTLYRDVFFPFLRIVANGFILISIIIYCINQSGIIFLPFLILLAFYYLIFFSVKSTETKAYSNKFILSQSINNDVIRFIFSNVNSFIYSFTSKSILKKSAKEFQGLVNNYFKLASALSIILFQLELLFVLLVAVVISVSFFNKSFISASSILIALLGLQKTLRTSQQISNSYTLFKNNTRSINNLFNVIKKLKFLINRSRIKDKKNYVNLNFDNENNSLDVNLSLEFLNKNYKKNKKAEKFLNLFFDSHTPTHIIANSGFGKTLILKKILEMDLRIEKEILVQLDKEFLKKENLIIKDIAFYLPQSPQLPPINITEFVEPFESEDLYKLMRKFNFSDSIINKFKKNNMETLDNLSLSGGEIQRLWIIKAILKKPFILILDEPFSALDPNTLRKISKLIPKLLPKKSILIVTSHVQLDPVYKKIYLDK